MGNDRTPPRNQRMSLADGEQKFKEGDKLKLPDEIWVNPVTVESYDRHLGFYHIRSPQNKKRRLVIHEGGYKVIENGHADWSYSHGYHCAFDEVEKVE